MAARKPIAFLSYVRSDDAHDGGRITAFRERLEGEVQMQTGKSFAIFQDRNDIAWGQNWEERIKGSLYDVTFLIPILTPSFFQSPACRSEFQTFLLKEKTLGVNRLILPVYVTCDQLGEDYVKGTNNIADVLRERNWTDWRQFRFKSPTEENVAAALAQMAAMIKDSMSELNAISVAASVRSTAEASLDTPSELDLPKNVTTHQMIDSADGNSAASPNNEIESHEPYKIFEARPKEQFDKATLAAASSHPYYAYTRQYDEVVDAGELSDQAELIQLYNYVSKFSTALKKENDTVILRMLSRYESLGPQLAVSILIDNSGSMRGRKITLTAAWCLLISEWLDRLGIFTEFLGYTTRAWKGGRSRELWLSDQKPSRPGRLNDLRHLIYKSFSADAGATAPTFGVMAREGLLKENIDGEAVLWAATRLVKQPADKKMLFVFTDGAPVDDSTLSVNPGSFLEKHLMAVIEEVAEQVALCAVGIGHDVSRYYPNAVKVTNLNYLGRRFFEALTKSPIFLECFSKSYRTAPQGRDPKQAYPG